jgi:hypothetical protein
MMRTAALALGTLLTLGTLIGCGGSKSNAGSGSNSSGSSAGGSSGSMSGTMSGSISGSSGSGASGTTAPQPCPTPTFSPAAGAIASGSNVVISAAGLPASGTIYFTTDGTMPTEASPVYNAGTVGVQVTSAETIQAISSTKGATCSDSPVATAMYTIAAPMMPDAGDGGIAPETPTFTPGGTMTTQANDFTVTLASTGAANVCYTLGATAPTCTATGTCGTGSMTYAAPIPISGTSVTAGSVEVQAIGCAADGTASNVAMAQYALQAATPTMTPAAGAQMYSATLLGTLATATTGATIDYTSNGMSPSCATPVAGQMTYAAPFALQAGTYNAIACKTGYLASTVGGPFAFTVALTPPVITPASGTLNVAPTFTVSNAANPAGSWVCYSTSATAPACAAAAGMCTAGTLLSTDGGVVLGGVTDGGNIQAIACAPPGLSNSTIVSQGPYKLQLAAPVILPDAATTPAAAYMLTTADTTAGHLAHLNIEQASVGTAADQPGGYLCWLKDPGVGIAPSCGTTAGSCVNGTATATGSGPFDIEALGPFAGGDSVAVVTCPGTTAETGLGFEGSTVSTTIFVGAGQALPPAISATDTTGDTADDWGSQVNAVVTNTNAAAMTVCYTTDGTTPACTPGAMAAGTETCSVVDGTISQNLNFKITNPGAGYVNPPAVVITPDVAPSNCTGDPVATLTAGGALASVTATGCMGYSTPPAVAIHTGTGAVATGTVTEQVVFTISNAGTGYSAAPAVTLTVADGVGAGSCIPTTTVAGGSITKIQATGCMFDVNPTVGITDATGTLAQATAQVTQTVTFGVTVAGNYYTANPVVTLAPGTVGTCTTLTSTQTGGAVTSVTATGCSGFTDFATNDIATVFAKQGPLDTDMTNAATAIAVPGNSVAVLPPIQGNGAATLAANATTVNAIACNAGLGKSAVQPAIFHTKLEAPTIVVTDTLTAMDVLALVAGSTPSNTHVSAGDTVTIATRSNFTDTKLVYTVDGSIPTCAGGGTTKAFTGTTTTIAVPDPSMTPLIVNVIACGANQLASAPVAATFPIDVAAPIVTATANTAALGTGTNSPTMISITAQNTVTVTITSPTAGSYVCYTTNGTSIPTCSPNANNVACPGGANFHLIMAPPAALPVITASPETVNAIACKAGKSSTVTGPVVYTLDVTAAEIVGTPTNACPSVAAVGFDYTAPSQGGPTTTADVCWSLAPFSCNDATNNPAKYNCFTPTMAAPTTPVSSSVENSVIYTQACKNGFVGTAVPITVTTVTPITEPTIAVDGTLNPTTEWSTALGDRFNTVTANVFGGFTFGKTNAAGDTLFFSESGLADTATTDVFIYLTDTSTQPAPKTTTTPVAGAGPLPFAAEYAIEIATGAAGCGTGGAAPACTITTYTNDGTNGAAPWTAQAAGALAVTAAVSATALEASIATSKVGTVGDAFDVTGVVYDGAHLGAQWSKAAGPNNGSAWTYVADYSSWSCVTPLASLQ